MAPIPFINPALVQMDTYLYKSIEFAMYSGSYNGSPASMQVVCKEAQPQTMRIWELLNGVVLPQAIGQYTTVAGSTCIVCELIGPINPSAPVQVWINLIELVSKLQANKFVTYQISPSCIVSTSHGMRLVGLTHAKKAGEPFSTPTLSDKEVPYAPPDCIWGSLASLSADSWSAGFSLLGLVGNYNWTGSLQDYLHNTVNIRGKFLQVDVAGVHIDPVLVQSEHSLQADCPLAAQLKPHISKELLDIVLKLTDPSSRHRILATEALAEIRRLPAHSMIPSIPNVSAENSDSSDSEELEDEDEDYTDSEELVDENGAEEEDAERDDSDGASSSHYGDDNVNGSNNGDNDSDDRDTSSNTTMPFDQLPLMALLSPMNTLPGCEALVALENLIHIPQPRSLAALGALAALASHGNPALKTFHILSRFPEHPEEVPISILAKLGALGSLSANQTIHPSLQHLKHLEILNNIKTHSDLEDKATLLCLKALGALQALEGLNPHFRAFADFNNIE